MKFNFLDTIDEEKCCFIMMTDDLCVIQDRISRTPIGVGEERNGLFFYKSLQLSSLHVCHMNTAVSSDLWNCC